MILRDYQAADMRRVAEAFTGHRRVLYVLPTGGGKTVSFTHAAAEESGRVAIVAHRRELIRQAHAKCTASGLDATTYPSATPGRITVGSIQTFARRLEKLPRFDLIVLDEAHHAVSAQYVAFLESQPQARVLGVTASPTLLDGRGLGAVFGAMVVGPSVAELTAAGWLVPAECYGLPATLDLTGVRTVAGDFNTADLEQIMQRPSLLGSAPEHYERLCPGVPALVFCCSVAHAEESAAAFRAEGWRFRAIHGGSADRDDLLAAFAAGRLDGLTSCSLIDEGLDIPDVACVVMQRPTKSLRIVMQQTGRGLRPAAGKAKLVVLDHAGNLLRHGLPDTPREWTLDGSTRRASTVPAVAQCPSCHAMHSPAPRCPECGHDYQAEREAAERREIEHRDGELALLTPDDRRIIALRETPLAVLLKRAACHADLVEIQQARGYHPAWVDQRARFLPRGGVRTHGEEFGA